MGQHRKSSDEGLQRWDYAGHLTTLKLSLQWHRHYPDKDLLIEALDQRVTQCEFALLAGSFSPWDHWFQFPGMAQSKKTVQPPLCP